MSEPWYPPRMTEAEKLEVSRRILAYNRSALGKAKVVEIGNRTQAARDAANERRSRPSPPSKAKASKKPVYDYLADDWRV
jgi:hypothetical protein